MKQSPRGKWLRITALLCIASMPGGSTVAAIKNLAVVMSTGSKLSDVPLADLIKLCKGIQKAWPDGKSFTLVIKNPEEFFEEREIAANDPKAATAVKTFEELKGQRLRKSLLPEEIVSKVKA